MKTIKIWSIIQQGNSNKLQTMCNSLNNRSKSRLRPALGHCSFYMMYATAWKTLLLILFKFRIMRCFIANEMVMFPSACTSLISFSLTHTHTWNSYLINRQCGKAVLKHAFITKNPSNIHTQVTIYTNEFRFGARFFFFGNVRLSRLFGW